MTESEEIAEDLLRSLIGENYEIDYETTDRDNVTESDVIDKCVFTIAGKTVGVEVHNNKPISIWISDFASGDYIHEGIDIDDLKNCPNMLLDILNS